MEYFSEYLKIFTTLVAIVNPIGAVPVFVSLTDSHSTKDKKRTIRTASLSVCLVLLIIMAFGQALLNYFGISIASFRVGGGLLILLMSISMMHGKQPLSKYRKEESEEAINKASIAVVPLAIPLLSGPGSISTVILYTHQANTLQNYLALTIGIILTALTVFITLSFAPKISSLIGKTGINIVTRIMGLIIAAIGVEFIAKGLLVLLPGLK